jgi:energy-coupling factor transporter ATP-binding protein EcfA2
MEAQGTSIRSFSGGSTTNRAENACFRRLQLDLEIAGTDAVLLRNIIVGPQRRQIDLVVATANTAVVIEIKGYIHPVSGGVNGPWSLERDDGNRQKLDGSNPYQQAVDNRFAVTDSLRATIGADVRGAVGGMLCLYPAAPTGSAIPASDFKLAIGGYADLVALLTVPRVNALSLDRWVGFAEANGLTDDSASPPSAADRTVGEYLAAYQDLGRATLAPYVEPLFEGDQTAASLVERSAAGEQFQIIGGSGSGKTMLLKHLGMACAAGGNIPVLVRGRDFDRDLGPLLRADTARFTREKVTALFGAADGAGADIVLHVDAINECPPDKRPDLVAALQAARINYGARIVLTGQDEQTLPTSLRSEIVRLIQPDQVQAQRIVEAHLGRALVEQEFAALEVVATAHDAAIFAQMLGETGTIDGRFSLYHGFTRARLKAAGIAEAHRGLGDLASRMRSGFAAAMPRSAAERIVDPDNAATADVVHSAGLIWSEGGRIGFRHDLIADFFAADALLRRAISSNDLTTLARQPIHAELREFLLGGCATTQDIATLLSNTRDSRLLESALSGRAGAKARNYVISRMRDLIRQLKQRYSEIGLTLPENVTGASNFSSYVPALAEMVEDDPVDGLFLALIPSALSDGLLPDLLDLYAAVDQQLIAEAARLKDEHPEVRLAWRAAAYGTLYGMHHFNGARHLQKLLHGIQNSWARRKEPHPRLGLAERLDAFETLSVGQLFLLVSALRSGHGEAMPGRFPELLQRIWNTQVYHLRLIVCDIIRFRGSELDDDDRAVVRELLDGYLSDNPFMNSTVFDALEGVGGLDHDFTVEDAVREYEAMLDEPETPESCSRAVSAVTQTYDHPCSDIYWEAFYEVLAVEKRQALLLRGLRDRDRDTWFINDILRGLRRDPTRAAEPELQRLALGPMLERHSNQFAVMVYAEAIALLATMNLPLDPPQSVPDDDDTRAWYCAAPLIHALNGGGASPSVDVFVACGIAQAFDVVQRLRREARNLGFRDNPNIAFESRWPDMVRDLARVVLSTDYVAVSIFTRFQSGEPLEEEHVDAALQLIAKVGRPTDLQLVQGWLEHPRHGEQALATARALEADRADEHAAW